MEITKKLVQDFYYKMLQIRYAEESLVEPILKGEVKTPAHLYSGEEAIATGLCANLTEKDYVFGNHRSHGHYLAKGGDLKEMMAEIYCKETGCSKGRGGSMHLVYPQKGVLGIVPIVAGTISLATGASLSQKVRKTKGVTISFFGDGSTGEGVLYESLNFASLKKLPIIFACENNLYSTHLPINEIRVKNNIANVAEPYNIKSFRVDGNNVFEVYEKSKEAVEYCRAGNGPVFFEFLTYRLRGHVGPDDNIQGTHTDIRPDEEIEKWRKKDPIKFLENYFQETGILSISEVKNIKENVQNEVNEAKQFAINSPKPNKSELARYVYK